jgi:hypothetical protein
VVEKFLGDGIGLGDVGDLSERAGFESREMHHGLEAVFSLVRQHDLPSASE